MLPVLQHSNTGARRCLSRHSRKGGDSKHSKPSSLEYDVKTEIRCLVRVTQPSVAALLSVGRKAPADWACSLWTTSHCGQCVLFSETLVTQALTGNAGRALHVTPVGDRAMRPSQTSETNWREAHYISTVDLSSTFPAELPPDALMCSECPCGSVCVFTSEKARQPKPMDTEQRRETS